MTTKTTFPRALPALETQRGGLSVPQIGPAATKFRVLDLFSGIGGFSLGLERTGGFETVAFCEIEDFPRRVLAKHWPGVPCYDDVRTLTGARLSADGITGINVITGGFPCQDLSVAGKQRGMGEGTRSGLWSEIVRLVGELRPQYVIVENVANLLSGPSEKRGGWFGRVLGDLAECGYNAEWENIPASALGAPHRRERIWLVAYPSGQRHWHNSKVGVDSGAPREMLAIKKEWERIWGIAWRGSQALAERNPDGAEQSGWSGHIAVSRHASDGGFWDVEPSVGRVANGVSSRLDRLKSIGNAVVPQIPELIGRAILQSTQSSTGRGPDRRLSTKLPPAYGSGGFSEFGGGGFST